MYDVIVVGAGPCGSVAANILAKHNLKTLLLDRYKLPRYKSCSGVLIEKSLKFIKDKLGFDVPKSVTCLPEQNRGMVFVDDNGKEYRFESRGLNIWRDKFDFWLTSLAKEQGAQVKDESAVSAIQEIEDRVCVSVNGRKEYAKFAIDCSGAVGIGKKEHNNIITFQTYNKGCIDLDLHYFYAYLQPQLSGYDAWFNVKDNMLVLGVAAQNAQDIGNYYDNFISYMKQKYNLVITEQLNTDKWIIRNIQSSFDIDYGSGSVLRAGESAGFLNPMGEGISCAMESGYVAAQSIISNFNDKLYALEEYKQNAMEIKNYMQRQWRLVGRMSEKFSPMRG